MSTEEFKSRLAEFKYYFKPALFTVLVENAGAFSEETKKSIIDKIVEADADMKQLYDYQEKRNGIMKQGLEKMDEIYEKVKAKFQTAGTSKQEADAAKADELISNM